MFLYLPAPCRLLVTTQIHPPSPNPCQARGKGHEVSDLRRLLELYMRWQQRVFPGVEFDRFIADVERLSGTHAVKHEMHEMRMALLMVRRRGRGGDGWT